MLKTRQWAAVALAGALLPRIAVAALGDCGQPLTLGANPTASDALAILKAAVDPGRECAPCVCDVDRSGRVVASDALATLVRAVGGADTFACVACPVTETVGADGGTVVSADGRVTLAIPPGALAEPVEFTIQGVAPSALPNDLGDLTKEVFEFLPTGIVFAQPVTITYELIAEDGTGRGSTGSADFPLVMFERDGQLILPDSAQAAVVPSGTPGRGFHSSQVSNGIVLLSTSTYEQHAAEMAARAAAESQAQFEAEQEINAAFDEEFTSDVAVDCVNPFFPGSATVEVDDGGSSGPAAYESFENLDLSKGCPAVATLGGVCRGVGSGVARPRLTFPPEFIRMLLERERGGPVDAVLPAGGYPVTLAQRVNCTTDLPFVLSVPAPSSPGRLTESPPLASALLPGTLSGGAFTPPPGAPDGFTPIGTRGLGLPQTFGLSGFDGAAIVEPREDPSSPGAIKIAYPVVDDDTNRFNTGSSIVLGGPAPHWYAGDAFGERHGTVPNPIPDGLHNGNVTHVQALSPQFDGLVRVDFSEPAIDVFEYDPVTGELVRRRLVGPAALAVLTAGVPTVAWHDPTRGVTIGATSGDLLLETPSQVFVHHAGDSEVAVVGTAGLDVRDLDCIEVNGLGGNDILCVTSATGSNSLTPLTFSAGEGDRLEGSVGLPVLIGNGPDGIDLRFTGLKRTGGGGGDPVPVASVVSTGFFDQSVHVTRFDAGGALVDDSMLGLPEGCSGPSSALWLDSGFVVSCFSSGAVAVFPEP